MRNMLPPHSLAVFFSAPVRTRSNDIDFPYHQQPDFYYMTGLEEPDAILLIFKDKIEYNYQGTGGIETFLSDELLFVRQRDSVRELWEGKRLGREGAKEKLGFSGVLYGSDFADFTVDFLSFDKIFFTPPPDDIADNPDDKGDLFSLIKHFRKKIAPARHKTDSVMLKEYLASIREIKVKEELTMIQKAVDITCSAINETMRAVDTSMYEYQVQALVEFLFRYHGSEYPGFRSITASGENTSTLHYTHNRRKLKDGDLLIIDVGAEYHGYTADVTRTIPVNGTFSAEQKIIYNIVLEAQQMAINTCKPGIKFWEPGDIATQIVKKRLKENGIIASESEYRKYFMHGVSHYVGLDVHDVGLYGALKPGTVFTIEPGIYIKDDSPCNSKWWTIGVRIEDDILVTENGCVVLSTSPATVEEIEKMMHEESLLPQLFQRK